MGSSGDDAKSPKQEKSSPPRPGTEQQNNVHVYPDWATMQAYYGPRVALPAYYNSAMAAGHPPPPYMWGPPQAMMPPYGAPYAVYPHGGVYAHPAVPLGPQSQGQAPSSPTVTAVTNLSVETPSKSPGNSDKGLIKKLKSFDGLAMSIGNGDADKADSGAEQRASHSAETETEGSSNGSDGNTDESYHADQHKRKRSREGSPCNAVEGEKTEINAAHLAAVEVVGVPVTHQNAAGQLVATAVTPSITTALDLTNPAVSVKGNSPAVSSEGWLQNEKEVKRERRKQSNRESARRSRLRKQAETEELAKRVESLSAENAALKSEINQLVDNSQKLRQENTAIMEKLTSLQSGQGEKSCLSKANGDRNPSDSTENLLSKINKSASVKSSEEAADKYEKSSNVGAQLHQLLGRNPRADAVAAS